MQDLLLYLDLPCRSIIRLLLYLDLACTLITPIHQKDLDRILPVYVIKTVHIYYLLLSPSINVDLCHHIDSQFTMKPRRPQQSLNLLLFWNIPRLDLHQAYKSKFMLYTYCWTSFMFKTEFIAMPHTFSPETSTSLNRTGLHSLMSLPAPFQVDSQRINAKD